VTCYIPRWFTHPQTVTRPSTNRAQCRLTTLIEANALTTTLHCHFPDSSHSYSARAMSHYIAHYTYYYITGHFYNLTFRILTFKTGSLTALEVGRHQNCWLRPCHLLLYSSLDHLSACHAHRGHASHRVDLHASYLHSAASAACHLDPVNDQNIISERIPQQIICKFY